MSENYEIVHGGILFNPYRAATAINGQKYNGPEYRYQ